MTKVLITGIGGDIAQCIALILRESFPDWELIGSDIHSRHGGGLFVDKLYESPRASDANYSEWIAGILQREEVDFCFPTSEAELLAVSAEGLTKRVNTRFIMANDRSIEVGTDKLLTNRLVESCGLPAPWTVPIEEFDAAVHLPCMFKLRRSAGSKGVFECTTASEVAFYSSRYEFAILQELLLPDDQEITCGVFRSHDGRSAVVQLRRRLVGGLTGWAQVIENSEIHAQCVSIAEKLQLHGSINIQMRLTADGPRIFEINPRFSSTVLMRHRMGFKDVIWSIQSAINEPTSFERPPEGFVAVRTNDVVIIKEI